MRVVAVIALLVPLLAVAGCGGDNLSLCDGCGTPTPTTTPQASATPTAASSGAPSATPALTATATP